MGRGVRIHINQVDAAESKESKMGCGAFLIAVRFIRATAPPAAAAPRSQGLYGLVVVFKILYI